MYGLFAGYFLGAEATPFPPLHFTMQTSSSAKTSEAGTGFFSAVFREDRRPRDDAGENDDRRDDGQDLVIVLCDLQFGEQFAHVLRKSVDVRFEVRRNVVGIVAQLR